MTTTYPTTVDNNLTLPKVVDLVSPIRATDHNTLQEAIIAIQGELGADPSGTFGTVKDRLDDILMSIAASDVSILDADGYFTATDVEGALREVAVELEDFAVTLTASEVAIEDLDGYFIATNVEAALRELASGVALRIGDAEDGTYTDGLFTDFNADTSLGVAIDRFNEVLGSLAPPPAPNLGDMSYTTSIGVAGNVSFGTSNAIVTYTNVGTVGGGPVRDINDTFTSAGGAALRKGIYATGSDKDGVIADSVLIDTGSPTPSYPANAFGDGEKGTLELEINGVVEHSIDLTSFGSGTSVNANGSGFESVAAATPISFPSGDPLDLFQFRTANWTVGTADERNGYNYARIIHDASPTFTRSTNYFEWVIDAAVTATLFSAESMSAPAMLGSKFISGIEYHTSGSADYFVTIDNAHLNTYSSSATAITHPTSTNCTIPSEPLINIAAETDSFVIANKTATIDVSRILNSNITVNAATDRTVQGDTNSGAGVNAGGISTGILLDNASDASDENDEGFDGDEDYRVPSNRELFDTSGFTIGGAGLWDSTISIVEGAPANAGYDGLDGYDAGLLMYNSQLFYPDDASVTNSGNFSTITFGPAGNQDYSAAAGQRTFWRYFFFSSTASNFVMNLNASATVVDTGTLSASTDEISVELLLPNTTSDGATLEFKDCNQNFTGAPPENGIGCFASTNGVNVGNTSGAAWGLATGTRNTSTSGQTAIIRLTVADSWTGSVQRLQLNAV